MATAGFRHEEANKKKEEQNVASLRVEGFAADNNIYVIMICWVRRA